MRHRRGIDLAPPEEQALELRRATLASLPQWFVLVAHCGSCQHTAIVDRWALARTSGGSIALAKIGTLLKCSSCEGKAGNHLLLGKLPRD